MCVGSGVNKMVSGNEEISTPAAPQAKATMLRAIMARFGFVYQGPGCIAGPKSAFQAGHLLTVYGEISDVITISSFHSRAVIYGKQLIRRKGRLGAI
jgi:hypothetical protein